MHLTGFTFIRNGFSLGYPFRESLRSLRELCDDVVIAVGDSTDGTREYLESLPQANLTIVDTIWDDTKREGGRILAEQTNLALAHCKGDWCLYLQGDELIHEQDYDIVRFNINRYDDNQNVEALLFRWLHFFGNYQRIGVGRQWYRREVRAFRNTGIVTSWADAQGFRVKNDDGTIRKIRAVQTDARIFHYGWVRHPRVQIAKARAFQRLYHDDAWLAANIPTSDEFNYYCYETEAFTGTHPTSMTDVIERDKEWASQFDYKKAIAKRPFAVAVTDWFEKQTGIRVGEFRNYVEVKNV